MFNLNVYRPLTILVTAVAFASIAACSGSTDGGTVTGGTGTAATSEVPASALAGVDGLVAYMNQLIDSGTSETSEPVLLGDASLPVDDSI